MSEQTRAAVSTARSAAPATPPTEARVLDGRYRLDEVVGRGGMATVYRAHDLVLRRDVAVKLFPPVLDDADDLLRHSSEIRILATLSHPGLVTLYDAGEVHDHAGSQEVYLVMELVNGSTLADRIQHGPMPVEEVVRVGRQVADALALVHEQAIVHRDIKPGNILIAPHDLEPTVKVADFGIARLAGDTRLTMTGVTVGTVRYLSPEQVTGSPLGPTSDVYSLGLVLIECLSGSAPFAGTLSESAVARLTSGPPVPDDVPPGLAHLLGEMTARDPSDRPTAARVARDLAALTSAADSTDTTAVTAATAETAVTAVTETIALPPQQAAAPAAHTGVPRTPPRRRRTALWATAAIAGSLLVGGLIVAAQDDSGTPTQQPLPTYPTVEGELGDALTTLQESVVP
jgi:eukaryotic-like serine/threonine-protein kinase